MSTDSSDTESTKFLLELYQLGPTGKFYLEYRHSWLSENRIRAQIENMMDDWRFDNAENMAVFVAGYCVRMGALPPNMIWEIERNSKSNV